MADRPPRFLRCEVVRVVEATGNETDDLDDPIPRDTLTGALGTVEGAFPDGSGDAWMLAVHVDGLRSIVELHEWQLQRTHVMEMPGPERMPLDLERCVP